MADDMTPEQIVEMQKKNCIFCKIISGEIDSKKVFENEHFLAILDIRPAIKGHVLFFPKQHVPILQLLPPEQLEQSFALMTSLCTAIQEAMFATRMTAFIASGYAAGQQAPHCIIHLIPRDNGDSLDMLDLEKCDVEQADALALGSLFKQATTQVLMHKKREDLLVIDDKKSKIPIQSNIPIRHSAGSTSTVPAPLHSAPSSPASPAGASAVSATTSAAIISDNVDNNKTVINSTLHGMSSSDSSHNAAASIPAAVSDDSIDDSITTSDASNSTHNVGDAHVRNNTESKTVEFETNQEALATALEMYPDLRRLIIAQPELVDQYVSKSPQLARLFTGVNVHALSLVLQRQEQEREAKKAMAKQEPQRTARELSEQELLSFIDGNEGLRTWLLQHPEELATRISENPRLQHFFADVDILDLAKRYRAYRQAKGDV